MNTKAVIIFGLAIVFGVAAVFLVQDWMKKRTVQAARTSMPTTTVVVAKTPLEFGAILRAEHLAAIEWPARAVPTGSFRTVKELVEGEEPRVVLRPVEINEPLLKTKVSGFGGRASLSAVLSDTMRAATIRVNDVNGVAGFVLPGDRVDVMLTRDKEGGNARARGAGLITDVLLQNVKVLATDQNFNESKEKVSVAKAVTLEVTARQAQKLVLAQTVGTLSLALRNATNAVATAARTVSIADLQTGEANVAKPKPKAPVQRTRTVRPKPNPLSRVKVVRGLKESDYQVVKERNPPPVQLMPQRPAVAPEPPSAETPTSRTMPVPLLRNGKLPISFRPEDRSGTGSGAPVSR